ncbi:MAG TPA: hypothetical protein VGO55_00955 [Allosphingosinicella sp.]|jgi:hypothetical protein|nr:hypothetical protein [Allosphingosinicella sp.]
MRDEIAAAGKYKNPLLLREDDGLQVITVAELFDRPGRPGRRLDLPMARADAVKAAAALGDADKQSALDLRVGSGGAGEISQKAPVTR